MFEDKDEIKDDSSQEQKMVFFYNREERIKKAPAIVQEYYNGGMRPVRGFKVLFLKQNRWILFALVLFVAFVWIYTGINKTREYTSIENINFSLSAFSYEGEIFTSICIKPGKKYESGKPVNVQTEFFFIENNNTVCEKQFQSLVYDQGEQYIRTKITDFDIIRVDAILTVNGVEKELSTMVRR